MSEAQGAVPAVPAGEPALSFWSRWVGVYFSPRAAFADIARKPDFILPLVVSVVSALALTKTLLAKVGMARLIRMSIEQSGRNMTAEQIDQAVRGGETIGLVMAHVGAILGSPIFLLIVAALGLAIVNAIFGGQINFRTSFAVACYVHLIGVLGVLMGLPLILFGGLEHFNPQNPIPSNIGFFLNPLETSKPLMAVAGSLDIFSFWMIALLGVGYSAAAGGKIKALSISAIYFGLWLVIVLGKVGLAVIS
ncbi:MAG: YIP1 family protein [Terriglobia bacterium]|jgi:hypothetical protein